MNGAASNIYHPSKTTLQQLRPFHQFKSARKNIYHVACHGNFNRGNGPYLIADKLSYEPKYLMLFSSRKNLKD